MKLLPLTLTCVAALGCLAQSLAEDTPDEIIALSPAALEELVAPIALYPDPLVGLILPASTRPAEIVLAARFLDRGGNAELAERESWDDSVKALTRYREVLEYLDRNLDWTRRLGDAFVEQPDDVMAAIQTVRARARDLGLLVSNSQHTVIVDDREVRIVPASPTVIYIPRYRPEVLYVTRTYAYDPVTWLTFGIGYGVGSWLHYDCDWSYRRVRIVHRPVHWYHAPDWRPPPSRVTHPWTHWKPDPRHSHRRSLDRRPSDHRASPHRPEGDRPRDDHRDRPPRVGSPDRSSPDRPTGDRRPEDHRRRERPAGPRDSAPRPVTSAPEIVSQAPLAPPINLPALPPQTTTSPMGPQAPRSAPPNYDRPPRRDSPRAEPRPERPPPSVRHPAPAVPSASPPTVGPASPRSAPASAAPAPRAAPPVRNDDKPTRAERHPGTREREAY